MTIQRNTAIGSVRVRYEDPCLKKMLDGFRAAGPRTARQDPHLSQYHLPSITLEALRKCNFQVLPDGNGHFTCAPIERTISSPFDDEIIFSSRAKAPVAFASLCFSYFLHCADAGIMATVHVTSEHSGDPSFHASMLLVALANMIRLAPGSRIDAFISGGYPESSSGDTGLITRIINNNRRILNSVIPLILDHGVTIKRIDIGGHYRKQVLASGSGAFDPLKPAILKVLLGR